MGATIECCLLLLYQVAIITIIGITRSLRRRSKPRTRESQAVGNIIHTFAFSRDYSASRSSIYFRVLAGSEGQEVGSTARIPFAQVLAVLVFKML
jgi:hypothetical protein